MEEIQEPVPDSCIVHSLEEARDFARSGLTTNRASCLHLRWHRWRSCQDEEELIEITYNGLRLSRIHQVLLEKSLLGMKEIEFEVIPIVKTSVYVYVIWKTSILLGFHR